VCGLVFPAHRYVLPIRDGHPEPVPIITVDFSDFTVDLAR